jgi:uncharacterized cofD-like protein
VRVTGIGGGHGLACTLAAARRYAKEVSAVVTVADDGGSSGRLTRELRIPPPGDIRNCLVALAEESSLSRLFQHRFSGGRLRGHAVGNILIAALTESLGDFALAVAESGRLIGARGEVHPATTELVSLVAEVDGRTIRGQVAVGESSTSIQAVALDPARPVAHEPAARAILEADQVVLGPGSLFTSLIATLLVPGIREALQRTGARRVFVCNARTQPGETTGLDAAAHLQGLLAHVGPDPVDVVLAHSPPLTDDGVVIDREALRFLGIPVVEADVATPQGRHDPERLARVLAGLV